MKLLSRNLLLLFSSMVICLTLVLAGCSPKIYNLSTSVAPNGSGTVSPSGGPFQGNVTLVATPSQYYEFSGWAGAASGNTNPLTVTMNSDKQIVAQFSKIKYNVQVTSNIPNGGTANPSSGTYDAGTTLTINATPANGYRFKNWGTDATGSSSPLNLLINGNKNITAYFTPEYILAVSADPNEGAVSPSGGMYDAGSAINLTATPSFPYAFTNWVGTDNNTANPTNVTMNSDKSVSVNFIKEGPTTPAPIKKGDHIYNGLGTVTISLNKYEWVEGTITVDLAEHVYILGPDGTNIKDFGSTKQANFRIMAPESGTYSIIVPADYLSTFGTTYSVTYTVYGQQ